MKIKKLYLFGVFAIMVLFSFLPIEYNEAGVANAICDSSSYFFCNTLQGTVDNIFQGGEKMIGYILGIIGSVALLLIIIAGIMYITSAGNEEKIALSKKIITGTVVGLGIALLAFSLLDVVLSVLNM